MLNSWLTDRARTYDMRAQCAVLHLHVLATCGRSPGAVKADAEYAELEVRAIMERIADRDPRSATRRVGDFPARRN